MIESIVILSRALGYRLVVEGIETHDQEQTLTNMECQYGQGFYIAKPMSPVNIIE